MTRHEQAEQIIEALRREADSAETALRAFVITACPGDQHNPVQHRDRQPPWCHGCGRDARGVKRGESR